MFYNNCTASKSTRNSRTKSFSFNIFDSKSNPILDAYLYRGEKLICGGSEPLQIEDASLHENRVSFFLGYSFLQVPIYRSLVKIVTCL